MSELRAAMIQEQIVPRGVSDPRVLEAIGKVPRHEFVPFEQRGEAHDDRPLGIGYDQTISQPYIVAYMTERLGLRPRDRVLEIGTGSGYQAAVLSHLVAEVFSVEIVEPLARRASRDLQRLGFHNVHVRIDDGANGWAEEAPFDAVIVTCAPEEIPPRLVEQIKEGGRMIIPVGAFGKQYLYLLEKRGGAVRRHEIFHVAFVPMTGVVQTAGEGFDQSDK